ncbi:exodeoxyribonuclease VII large subunit [Paratractidigestivibacter sp.]|uniref:exodeoxyribonuclease VII large subunit n=1 Tax=Paratractidigestivibacter sp. TaxID=2847316 RepID=UPI002ABE95E3|nr:exodeoxyribonuclease VII large subunit [Paratractidigestivibacter sp.]
MAASKEEPLSVSEAVGLAKGNVAAWPALTVTGEVSGFRGPNARSGHCYFEVKDDGAAMSVIVWRGTYAKAGFELRDGLQVQLTGKFDIYQASGKFSFVASRLEVAGEGVLRQQVAELARKLEREGLMDADRKRRIPAFCSRICVCTSLSGSVIEDVKRTLKRRNPLVAIDVVGCSVQGATAPATIVRALEVAGATAPDAVLLVRGGGSFEDLMCFNDEQVARAVAACPVPVVTGIGHEPDTSIADMVADRRCSTPTAAAESVAPAIDEVERQMVQRRARLGHAMTSLLERSVDSVDALDRLAGNAMASILSSKRAAVEAYATRPCLTDPAAGLRSSASEIEQTAERLHAAVPRNLARLREGCEREAERLVDAAPRVLRKPESDVARLAATLDALSPLKVLGRGYAIARDDEGHVLKSASDTGVGDVIGVQLGKGSLRAQVVGVEG